MNTTAQSREDQQTMRSMSLSMDLSFGFFLQPCIYMDTFISSWTGLELIRILMSPHMEMKVHIDKTLQPLYNYNQKIWICVSFLRHIYENVNMH